MDLIDAIYTRQSVDRVDSISVESQVEFCKREVIGEDIKVYTDKGYSGKNTDRPAFQEMMADITAGKIRRVIVYRLDRISRSVLDFASVIDMFQKYGVDFVSTMEKFDTGTPIGKAMLMIVMILLSWSEKPSNSESLMPTVLAVSGAFTWEVRCHMGFA